MSEEMRHEDALEQRLHAHYASEFGNPPSPDTVWTVLKEQLPSSRGETSGTPTVEWHPAPARPFPPLPTIVHQTHALRLRSVLSIVAAGLLVALFAVVLLRPFGHTNDTAGTSTVADTPLPAGFTMHVLAPDELWPGTTLSDLQMLSPDEGWAVGNANTSTSSKTVILHYTRGRWTASPDVFPNVNLLRISMLSSTEGWVAGYTYGSDDPTSGTAVNDATTIDAVFLHYANGHWASVPAPGLGQINSLSMLTPRDGWAIQSKYVKASNSTHLSLLHYNGTAWSIVDTGGMSLYNLAMLSPSEGWASGQDGAIAHFQNGAWTRWPTTAPGDVDYLTMLSPTEGWMSGIAPGYSADPKWLKPHHPFMLHYNGRDWQPVTLPALPNLLDVYPDVAHYKTSAIPSSIGSVSMVSPEEGWAAVNLNGTTATMLYHYSGGGWHIYPFGVNAMVNKIYMVSTGEGWAIGQKIHYDKFGNLGEGADGVVLHYTQGSWTIYKP